MDRTVVCDIECDSLTPTKIWCIVCKDCDNHGELFKFTGESIYNGTFKEFAKTVGTWIGHNFLSFDSTWINELVPGAPIVRSRIIDTLILSRLLSAGIVGGHSLRAWGERLKFNKQEFKGDFSRFTQEMLEYCVRDVEVNYKLYLLLKKKLIDREDHCFDRAIKLEHFIQNTCDTLSNNGFYFNIKEAKNLYNEINKRLAQVDNEIKQDFKPRAKFIKVVTPKLTKKGTLSRTNLRFHKGKDFTCFSPNCPFSLIRWEEFNPGSPKQVVTRLNEFGWKPVDKTKGHKEAEANKDKQKLVKFREFGWSVNEKNLSTLPEDCPNGAKLLLERTVYDSRRSTLEEWFKAYSEHTHRVHGRFTGIGCWTHRLSHSKPNMANIAAEKSIKYKGGQVANIVKDLGKRMRSLWCSEPGRMLVGVDAQGVQLRILAHYINDETFTNALVSGNKEHGTDCHTLNQKALGPICKTRDNAKTFIFAWLLGAGTGKISEILGCTKKQAKEATENFIKAYPGLRRLKNIKIPDDALKGYFSGLDGRLVKCDSEHLMLAGYLQEGESTLMKHALKIWVGICNRLNIDYRVVNFVHDEYVTEVNNKHDAELVAKIQKYSIAKAGKLLKLRCPTEGDSNTGKTWYDVH